MTTKRPETSLLSEAARTAVRRMEEYVEWSGLEMLCVDCESTLILAKSHPHLPDSLPLSVRTELDQVRGIDLVEAPPNFLFFRIPLGSEEDRRFIAIGAVHAETPEFHAATRSPETGERKCDWSETHAVCSAKMLRALLATVMRRGELENQLSGRSPNADRPAHSKEQTRLLQDFPRLLDASRDSAELADLCLKRMREMLDMGGSAIWLQESDRTPKLLRHGSFPFDELELAHLIARFDERCRFGPLVQNHLEGTSFADEFPGLLNFAVVPIGEGRNRCGWIVGCNCRVASGRGFGMNEVVLLSSIARILETHVRNSELYRRHEELMLSFVRSLVSTLDAKDPYTRGHSQRVAQIARRLGEQLEFADHELHDIFLAGLLHDIGKVAINDATLQKPGELTEDEFRAIKQHPVTGYCILQELTNLNAILPGVRNHHESFDGSGYPDGLVGTEIPMMARILAVADSYDAMTSDRPYRNGMPVEQVEKILRASSGRQWDPDVVDAYFECRDDVRVICEGFSAHEPLLLKPPETMADVLFNP